MLKIAGHVKKYYKPCCAIYDDFNKSECATFEYFLSEIHRFSNQITDSDEQKIFCGDMLEILAEIFFGAFANDPSVGIKNYSPIPLDQDYGVDGIGTNAAGKQCVVQVKYKKNPLDKITYADISKTYTSGIEQHKIPLYEGQKNIFIFTSAYDISVSCKTILGDKIHLLNRGVIKYKIDNNVSFWNYAYNEIKETLLGPQ